LALTEQRKKLYGMISNNEITGLFSAMAEDTNKRPQPDADDFLAQQNLK